MKKGLNERMLEKRKWSFVAPIGYLNKDREIVRDPERFPILHEAWSRYATGAYTVPEIVDWLYAQGLRTRGSARRPAGRKLYRSPVHAMFNNPFYYSMMRYNGQTIPGTHDPMITKTTFDRVQGILKNRANPRPYELLRKAMKDAHVQEKEFRDNAIAALRHRQDEIQNSRMETLLTFARRLGDIFTSGDAHRKMTALKLVASNATRESQKARLNLRPAFAVLVKVGPGPDWQATMNDLRTALLKDPLPVEVVKNLLSDVGDAA